MALHLSLQAGIIVFVLFLQLLNCCGKAFDSSLQLSVLRFFYTLDGSYMHACTVVPPCIACIHPSIHPSICVCVCMHIYIHYISTFIQMRVYVYAYIYIHYISISIHMCICMCVCGCVYAYIYICTLYFFLLGILVINLMPFYPYIT